MLTVGSLFAGIGGIELGLERTGGFKTIWQVESDDYARRVLAKHWPDVRRWDDVRTFVAEPGWGSWERPDLICGGDPCQGNSNAGSIWKAKHEDMGSEFVRVVRSFGPRLVLRENPWPSRPDALWPWNRMRDCLEGLGYVVLPFRLRSCCLGANHRRDRVWLLGEMPDSNRKHVGREGCSGNATQTRPDTCGARQRRIRADTGSVVGSAILSNADCKRLEGMDGQRITAGNDGRGRSCSEPGQRQDGLPTPRVCRSRDEVPNLVDRIRCVGNAVDPFAAQWIGERILEAERELMRSDSQSQSEVSR